MKILFMIKPKKFCPYCNQSLIDEDKKFCEECKKKFHLKETNKRDKNKEPFDRKKWNKENKEYNDIYSSDAWETIRDRATSEQLDLCLICYIKGVIKHGEILHHIIPLKDDKSKAYKLDNLIFVCRECHGRIHSIYENDSNDKKELQMKLKQILKNVTNSFKIR